MSYIEQIIGNNIKKYRETNSLTLEKLAEKIGISYQNLSKIEHGKSFLKAKTFEKFCEALNITPEQLVSLDGVLPEKTDGDIKPLLQQIINTLDEKQSKALYKLVLAFLEAVN